MMQKLTFCAVALTGTCLLPPVAMAQDNSSAASPTQTAASTSSPAQFSEFTLGTQWVGGANTGQYGRYNGFTEQGLDVLLGFTVQKRAPWDSGKTWYYDITGLNLNFQTGNRLAKGFEDKSYSSSTSNKLGPTAEISVSFGDQGKWGITAGYDAISYTGNIINSIYTVDGTTGMLNNNLAAWGGATNDPLHKGTTTAFTTLTLTPAEKPFQVGTRRDTLQLGGQYILGDWTFSTNIRHEHREGTLEESLRATYGGMAFTMPVDYDTDRFDLSAAYNLPDFQALIQYTYSRFTDNNVAVSLPFPASIATLSASSGPYAQTALYSAPPSNSAHYVTAMLVDKVSPGTRISLNGRLGVELQNSTFPANSGDPNLSSALGNPTYAWFKNLNGLNQGTSATSPDAVAWVYQGNITVTSKLATDLDGRASYSFDGRNVHLNQYQVWIGGSSPDATANTAVFVVPQNWFKQTATVEVGYRILPASNTKVTVNYSFNDTSRGNAQVEHSTTNSESVQLSSMLGSDIMGRISYEHGDRTGRLVYGTAWGNLESGSPEVDGTPSGAYYQAPMTSDSVIVRADYAPASNLSGGLFLKYADERFHYPAVPSVAGIVATGDWNLVGHGQGIRRDYNLTVGPDVSYRPSQDVNLHLYYTYEQIFFDNVGNGACAESNTGVCAGSAGYFQNKYTSSMNSAGLSGDWQASDKLKLGAEYNMSSGSVIFGQFNGVMVTSVTQSYQNVTPYPDINSTMHDLRMTAVYQFTDKIEGSLMYEFSMFHNNDWSNLTAPVQASTNTGTAISILTPGYSSPNYNVSTIGAVFRVVL
jgi:hypothetical protein